MTNGPRAVALDRLRDEVALITGGAMGLGKAIAQRLAAEGAKVVISDAQTEAGQASARECGFTFIHQDVCNEASWVEVIGEVEQRFGRLNILVNNAGIVGPMSAVNPENTTIDAWRRIFSVNVEGVFLGCRAAIPAMRRAGGGWIVNMSSVAALVATPNATAYGASKAAVRQLTKSVAQHCAEQRLRIRCNSVHPGDVLTPLWMKHAAERAQATGVSVAAIIEEARVNTPVGELVTAEDIAAAVAFLVSPDAHLVTGIEMIVDGGYINCDSFVPSPPGHVVPERWTSHPHKKIVDGEK